MAGAMLFIMFVFILMTRSYVYATHAVVVTDGDEDDEGGEGSSHSINN